jgi:hypothetical protein
VDPELRTWLARLERKIDSLIRQGEIVMADLTQITAQVAANTSVEGSAATLIQGLAAQIAAAGTDPVALAALVSQLNTSETALAAAVAANTPAAPPAPTAAPAARRP